MSCAIGFACDDSATYCSAVGSTFTQTHMPIDDSVPRNNPQNAAGPVARFHSIPRITVPNNGAMKKLNSACT